MNKLIYRIGLFALLILVCQSEIVFGQKEAYRWYFGRKAGFDFTTTPPTMLTNGPYPGVGDVEEAHAAISDKNGNYLFYTNGEKIWDNTGTQMPNGSGLNGNYSTTQCATVFPVPGSATDYYVLTTPVTGSTTELQWNRIDMSLNSGKGDIKTPVASNKNQSMPSCPTYMMESVVSVPHFNGTDIWVIAHTADDPGTTPANEGGSFIVWLVTSAGIAYSNTYTLGYAYPASAGVSKGIGIMKSNSCFTKVFISYYNASSRIEGFSFSNSTGAVSNWPAPVSGPLVIDQYKDATNTMVPIGSFSYGLEVSGNSRYLYNTISGEGGGVKELTQYDLQAGTGTTANIINSAVRLTPASPGGDRYGQLQIGPDGKIYHTLHNWNNIGSGGYCKIGVIDAPNTGGTGATFIEQAYVWPATATGVGSTMGLTSFHKGFLAGKAAINSSFANLQQICLGDNVDFAAQTSGATISMYQWNIDKNLNNTIDFSGAAVSSINYTYPATGSYTVELTVTDQCGYNYTSTSQVQVLAKPTAAGTLSCSPVLGNVTSPNGAYTYVWYSDAAATNAIATGTTNVSLPIAGGTGNVYLKATSGSSSASTGLTNAPSGGHPWGGNDAGTTHTMGFTVNKAPLTFGSFGIELPYGAWAASNQNTTFNVSLKNVSSGVVYYSANHTVASDGPTWVSGYPFTETVNASLPLGNYQIIIKATSGSGGPVSKFSGCTSNQLDTKSALTYASSGVCGIAGDFTYTLTEISTTALACSQVATIPYNCPLPVSWLSFTANRTAEASSVLLNWSTASEQNNKVFYIQRSLDGISFETIGQLSAAGNSSSVKSYEYIDAAAPSGSLYYRIVQEDYNGVSTLSNIETVNSADLLQLSLVPNPGNGNFKIIGLSENIKLEVSVYSVTGQFVFNTTTVSGEIVDLSELAKGFYIVKIRTGNSIQSIRFINQ
jgi:hypothetical protein